MSFNYCFRLMWNQRHLTIKATTSIFSLVAFNSYTQASEINNATDDMERLGRVSGTDKITHHGYQRFYPRYLENYRKLNDIAMMEIGVDSKRSLQMWLDYFPNAFIYGLDVNFNDKGDRYNVFKANQRKIDDLMEVKSKIDKPVFFIIDDGSHIPDHQILTFDYFFESLLIPGGIYIIEDIETSYWTCKEGLYGYPTLYGYHHPKSTVELFKRLVDDVNEEFLKDDNKNIQKSLIQKYFKDSTRQWISSITFGQNCIIIVKKTEEEKKIFGIRQYRFTKKL